MRRKHRCSEQNWTALKTAVQEASRLRAERAKLECRLVALYDKAQALVPEEFRKDVLHVAMTWEAGVRDRECAFVADIADRLAAAGVLPPLVWQIDAPRHQGRDVAVRGTVCRDERDWIQVVREAGRDGREARALAARFRSALVGGRALWPVDVVVDGGPDPGRYALSDLPAAIGGRA